MKPVWTYKLTMPDDQTTFLAAIAADEEDMCQVFSTRDTGEWHLEDWLQFSHLLFPEQRLSEWTIEEIDNPPDLELGADGGVDSGSTSARAQG